MPSDRPTKPHGTFTPASKVSRSLSSAGYGRSIIRKGEALGGHRCSWDKEQQRVWVRYQVRDITPVDEADAERTEMLGLYEQLLVSRGYRVERNERSLYVYMRENTDMPAPKPTIEEQIKALAVLREVSSQAPIRLSPSQRERQLKEAIDTLDNADIFRELDEASLELEAEQKENPS